MEVMPWLVEELGKNILMIFSYQALFLDMKSVFKVLYTYVGPTDCKSVYMLY